MRTGKLGSGTVRYPDVVCFAFNPITIEVHGISETEFDFNVNHKTYGTVQMSNGWGKVDISEYVRAYMGVTAPMNDLYENITVEIDAGAHTLTFFTTVVWGSIRPGEVFYPLKQELTIFRNLPWTVTIFNPEDEKYYLQQDGGLEEEITSDVTYENASLEYYIKPETETAVVRIDSKAQQQTMSFQYTANGEFKRIEGDVLITLKFDDRTDGVYLRWTDRQGRVLYWLFKRGETAYKIAREGQELPVNEEAVYGMGRAQGKTVQESVKVSTYLIDRPTYITLLSILTSPFVDVYRGRVDGFDVWEPVEVDPATITDKGLDLQSLEFVVNMPETINQVI